MRTVLLPPGVNTIAVNKYIKSNHIISLRTGKVMCGPDKRHTITEGSTAQERLSIFLCKKKQSTFNNSHCFQTDTYAKNVTSESIYTYRTPIIEHVRPSLLTFLCLSVRMHKEYR